jgi:hypothetical protein
MRTRRWPRPLKAGANEVYFYERNSGPLAARALNKIARFVERYLLPD